MVSERKALEATVHSTSEAVRFHQARGPAGQKAAADAARIRDEAQARLTELRTGGKTN